MGDPTRIKAKVFEKPEPTMEQIYMDGQSGPILPGSHKVAKRLKEPLPLERESSLSGLMLTNYSCDQTGGKKAPRVVS